MSRIATPALATATGATAEVYTEIRKSIGKVPNTFATIGAHGPHALKAMLHADSVLANGSLSKPDQEAIKLAASAAAGCDYCEDAHSMLAKLAGLTPEAVAQIRVGAPTGNAKRDALVAFVRNLVRSSGTVSDDAFAAIRAAGYSDAQLVDISLAIAVITFTNVFNRINNTELDLPEAA
jgi:uncharacterized peroxidase-related enzyme